MSAPPRLPCDWRCQHIKSLRHRFWNIYLERRRHVQCQSVRDWMNLQHINWFRVLKNKILTYLFFLRIFACINDADPKAFSLTVRRRKCGLAKATTETPLGAYPYLCTSMLIEVTPSTYNMARVVTKLKHLNTATSPAYMRMQSSRGPTEKSNLRLKSPCFCK